MRPDQLQLQGSGNSAHLFKIKCFVELFKAYRVAFLNNLNPLDLLVALDSFPRDPSLGASGFIPETDRRLISLFPSPETAPMHLARVSAHFPSRWASPGFCPITRAAGAGTASPAPKGKGPSPFPEFLASE